MKSLAKVNLPEESTSKRTLGDLLKEPSEKVTEMEKQGKHGEKKKERSYRSDLEEGMWWENMKASVEKRAAPGTLGQSPTPTPEMMAGQPQEPAIKKAKTSN